MKSILIPVLFACGTALCWGMYGPTIHNAQSSVKAWSPFKPYVFIGVAYLVWACVGGLAGMMVKGDQFSYSGSNSPAMTWGFLAGSLGAIGALCLTSAMISGGKPLFVMPIVFGGAVSVTAIFTVLQMKDISKVNPMLWVGMVAVVVGVVLVAANTPHAKPKPKGNEPGGHAESASGTDSAPPAPSGDH